MILSFSNFSLVTGLESLMPLGGYPQNYLTYHIYNGVLKCFSKIMRNLWTPKYHLYAVAVDVFDFMVVSVFLGIALVIILLASYFEVFR